MVVKEGLREAPPRLVTGVRGPEALCLYRGLGLGPALMSSLVVMPRKAKKWDGLKIQLQRLVASWEAWFTAVTGELLTPGSLQVLESQAPTESGVSGGHARHLRQGAEGHLSCQGQRGASLMPGGRGMFPAPGLQAPGRPAGGLCLSAPPSCTRLGLTSTTSFKVCWDVEESGGQG